MKEQELRGILSNNIKRCRLKRNLSQLVLAEKLNISTNFLSDIERCKAWISPNTKVAPKPPPDKLTKPPQ
jgi:ribosome-binding protein aMBF1 (putative translation factor)